MNLVDLWLVKLLVGHLEDLQVFLLVKDSQVLVLLKKLMEQPVKEWLGIIL